MDYPKGFAKSNRKIGDPSATVVALDNTERSGFFSGCFLVRWCLVTVL